MNFQMFKLDLEKTEKPEIKLQPPLDNRKSKSSRKTTTALLTTPKPLTVSITTNCGRFFKRWEYQTTYLPSEKPVCGSRSNSENRTWKKDWFKLQKGVHQGSILSSHLFNLYSDYVMWCVTLDEAQVEIKIARRNINNLRYADNTTLMAESEEELKSLLMKVKEENEKAGLKLSIQKTKIMASGPITSWQIDRKQWKQWETLFSWAPKSLQMVAAAVKLKDTCSLKEKLWQT